MTGTALSFKSSLEDGGLSTFLNRTSLQDNTSRPIARGPFVLPRTKPSAELTQETAEAGLNRAVLEQTCPAQNQKEKKSPQRWAALLPATQNATFGDKQPPGDRDPPHQGVWESQLQHGRRGQQADIVCLCIQQQKPSSQHFSEAPHTPLHFNLPN